MALPTGTYTRTGPASCGTTRPDTLASTTERIGAVCQETIYTRDADDVTTFDTVGPTLNFALRLNSFYTVVI